MRVLALLALVLACPVASAQILVEPVLSAGDLARGQAVELELGVENPTQRAYVIVAEPARVNGLSAVFEPSRARLDANGTLVFALRVEAEPEATPGRRTLELRLTSVDAATGALREHTSRVDARITRPPEFLGGLGTPLPAPFADARGIFLAELLLWGAVAAIVLAVARTLRLTQAVRGRVLRAIAPPAALLVLAVGTGFSLRLFEHPFVAWGQRGLTLVAVVLSAILAHRALTTLFAFAKARHDGAGVELVTPILEKVVAIAVTAIAFAFGLQVLGVDLGFLLAGGVVVGLVLSLAAQDTLSNLFSGFFILFDRPFREGDEIRLDTGEVCRVDRIGLRSTRLYHFRHEQQMIVPNNELATKRVTNMSYPDTTYRLTLRVDVAHESDLRRVDEVMTRVARHTPDVLGGSGRDPVVWLRGFNESGIETQLRVYIPSSRHRNPVRTALVRGIQEAFYQEGIEIPVPHRDIRLWMQDREDEE